MRIVIPVFWLLALLPAKSYCNDDFDAAINFRDPRTHSVNLLNEDRKQAPAFKVLVDPGHGGKDLGAQGYFSVSEKSVALTISKMVVRELEKQTKYENPERPIEVRLTREDDRFLSLKERVATANAWAADLFVSIHANSSPSPRIRGFEVYFLNAEATDEQAQKLARIENAGLLAPLKNDVLSILSDVQANNHVTQSSHFAERVFSSMATRAITQARAVRQGPFTVLHGTTMPAILIEVGYVTNVEDALNLSKDSYLKRLASAISVGVLDFIRKPNAESIGWKKTQRTSPTQSNPTLSQSPGRKLSY